MVNPKKKKNEPFSQDMHSKLPTFASGLHISVKSGMIISCGGGIPHQCGMRCGMRYFTAAVTLVNAPRHTATENTYNLASRCGNEKLYEIANYLLYIVYTMYRAVRYKFILKIYISVPTHR
jgi:hypothetical protein